MRRGRPRLAALVSAAAALGAAASAHADDAICADRPTKAFAPCTTPQGAVQIETGLVDGGFLRQGGVTSPAPDRPGARPPHPSVVSDGEEMLGKPGHTGMRMMPK